MFRHRANIELGKQDYDAMPLRYDEVRTEWNYWTDGPKHYRGDTGAKYLRK